VEVVSGGIRAFGGSCLVEVVSGGSRFWWKSFLVEIASGGIVSPAQVPTSV
jgi:hypothetical protein